MPANKPIIAPSLLAASFGKLESEISRTAAAGSDWLHLDIMDGSFVPAITFGDNIVRLARSLCELPLDVHLMIERPDKHLSTFAEAGASTITIHAEASQDLKRDLIKIRSLGVKAGVSIKPETDYAAIQNVLEDCDLILIMTVNPGKGGQAFIDSCLTKVELTASELQRQKLPAIVEVDGGINLQTARHCLDAGATALVAGSFLYRQSDLAQAIKDLRNI